MPKLDSFFISRSGKEMSYYDTLYCTEEELRGIIYGDEDPLLEIYA